MVSAKTFCSAAAEFQGRPEGGIDLVVSDLGLPDGSGLDLMRELSCRYGLRGTDFSWTDSWWSYCNDELRLVCFEL